MSPARLRPSTPEQGWAWRAQRASGLEGCEPKGLSCSYSAQSKPCATAMGSVSVVTLAIFEKFMPPDFAKDVPR